MRALPATLLAAVLALLLAAPAQAAGSSPSAPPNASPEVKAIYTDYSRDGTLVECDHAQADLQTAYDTMTTEVGRDFPDFRDEVKVAIAHHKAHRCANEDEGSPAATATPSPAATPAPTASPAATPESGRLPESQGATPQSGALPPGQAITPVPSATVPPVATPAPTDAPGPVPTAAPPVVATHASHGDVTVPAALIALALLGAAALALSAFAGRRSPGVRHAWREAAFRTRGTWDDFSDWLRLGR